MQSGEGQHHLGLDAPNTRDPASGRMAGDVLKQSRLPDPGVTTDHQRTPSAGAHIGDQPVQDRALRTSATELARCGTTRHG
jgi:hypothetical protein